MISSELHFLPSISEISNQYFSEETRWSDHIIESRLRWFIEWAQNNYDIVLFDCQAGYTELLPLLLPQINVALFVLETDSISGSAMRSLHLKIGRYLSHAHIYQVLIRQHPRNTIFIRRSLGLFSSTLALYYLIGKLGKHFLVHRFRISKVLVQNTDLTFMRYAKYLCLIQQFKADLSDFQLSYAISYWWKKGNRLKSIWWNLLTSRNVCLQKYYYVPAVLFQQKSLWYFNFSIRSRLLKKAHYYLYSHWLYHCYWHSWNIQVHIKKIAESDNSMNVS